MIITVEERMTRRHAFHLPDEIFPDEQGKDFIRAHIKEHGIEYVSNMAPITRILNHAAYLETDSEFSECIDIEDRNEWFADDDELSFEMQEMLNMISCNIDALLDMKAKYGIGQAMVSNKRKTA